MNNFSSIKARGIILTLSCSSGQAASLGPLLYCLFSNDLSLFAASSDVTQYADDTQVFVSGKKSALPALVGRMETALAALDSWFRANSLKVNASKTQLIVFGTRQNLQKFTLSEVSVMFRGVPLQPCTEVKNLGVVFDSHLSWDQHISLLTRCCFGMLTGLAHLRHYLPETVLSTIVSALVLSHVRYCLTVYGNGRGKWGKADYLRNSMQYLFTECLYLTKDFSIG